MLRTYVPILSSRLLAFGFAVFSDRDRSACRTQAVQPREARRVRVRHRAVARRGPGAGRFPVKFYLTAMLFIVFDIEIIFLYPWAVSFGSLGVFGLVEMVLFVLTVFVAYAYVWRRGGLEWD